MKTKDGIKRLTAIEARKLTFNSIIEHIEERAKAGSMEILVSKLSPVVQSAFVELGYKIEEDVYKSCFSPRVVNTRISWGG